MVQMILYFIYMNAKKDHTEAVDVHPTMTSEVEVVDKKNVSEHPAVGREKEMPQVARPEIEMQKDIV